MRAFYVNNAGFRSQGAVFLTAVLAAFLSCASPVHAQEIQAAEETLAAAPEPVLTAIPASEIPGRAGELGRIIRAARRNADFAGLLETIGADFGEEKEHIAELEVETQRRLEIDGPASVIEEAEKVWIRSGNRLDGWLEALSSSASAVESGLVALREERGQWELTRDTEQEEELPEAVLQQIGESLESIETVRRELHTVRDAILTLQADVARQQALVEGSLAIQREEIEQRRHGLIGVDSPPIWKAFAARSIDGAPSEQIVAVWEKNFQSVRDYATDQRRSLESHFLSLVLITIGVIFLRRKAVVWVKQDKSLEQTVRLLDRPFAAALIITLAFSDLMHPDAPSAWLDFLGLIMLFAMLRLLPQMLSVELRPVAYQLALLFFLRQAVKLAPDGNLVNRLVLLVLSSTALLVCWWLMKKFSEPRPTLSDTWRRALLFYLRIGFFAFLLGAVANIAGSVGIATIITLGTLNSMFSAVIAWVAAMLLRALVRVSLLTRTARKFGLVRLHADTVRETLFRWIQAIAVFVWVNFSLQGFGILESTVEGLKRAVGGEISIGDFSMTPGDILVFALLVWISFKISQLLRFVLDTDIMPRMDLPRGVPGAINRLTHYAVIVVGFLVAGAAAGLDFSRVSLIIGALGVGIGFGLQNVVNNFVSGLILLFERPIRVGDRVQLEKLSGEVKSIGMRASIVRTWEGAEVIVPNANFISSEVINWTLSDDRRRLELGVGVAYGTDPNTVIELLTAVASEHPEVLGSPEPATLFRGFGESSLDFELRAWTRTEFVRVASELRVAMNDALADAGIEIPFPQRDLHLRSVDSETAEIFKGEPEYNRDR